MIGAGAKDHGYVRTPHRHMLLGVAVAVGLSASVAMRSFGQIAASSAPVDKAEQELLRDIDAARAELTTLLRSIGEQRLEMVRKVEQSRREIRDLRQRLEQTDKHAAEAEEEAVVVRRKTEHLRSLVTFVDTVATEYRRAFETRISGAQRQHDQALFEELDRLLGQGTAQSRLTVVPRLLELARTQTEDSLGGRMFAGSALDIEGNVIEGRFAEAGPITYFAATDRELAGIVIHRPGSTLPSVFADFDTPEQSEGIRRLVQHGEGAVPLDVTVGSAIRLRQAKETLAQHIRKGGITMIPLLALAGVCALLALYKFLSLSMVSGARPEKRIRAILEAVQEGRIEDARKLALRLRRPLGPVISEGIEHRAAPKEHIEEIMYERILSMVPGLEKRLAPLAVCASAAPLLGLLGTVTGMIHTFRLITVFGTGDARLLSSGISEALITTEFGLMIAIPALLLHAYLSRRVRKIIAVTQQAAVMFVNGLKLRPQTQVPVADATDSS